MRGREADSKTVRTNAAGQLELQGRVAGQLASWTSANSLPTLAWQRHSHLPKTLRGWARARIPYNSDSSFHSTAIGVTHDTIQPSVSVGSVRSARDWNGNKRSGRE